MKFHLVLFILALKLKKAARSNPVFKQFIKGKQLAVTITTHPKKTGRQYLFCNGRITSTRRIDKFDTAMVWSDPDTAFKTMTCKNDEAVVAALTEKKLIIKGSFKAFMWFARALELMAAKTQQEEKPWEYLS